MLAFSVSNISFMLDEVFGFIMSNAFETSLHIKKLVESGQFHAPKLVGRLHVGFLVLFMSCGEKCFIILKYIAVSILEKIL